MSQSFEQLLDAREREVRRTIDGLRATLAPLEAELEKIAVARAAISAADIQETSVESGEDDRYRRMTYEELATEALASDRFEFGATIGELLGFISREYGREIAQSSFSPILSRMYKKGLLAKFGKSWFLKSVKAEETVEKKYDL